MAGTDAAAFATADDDIRRATDRWWALGLRAALSMAFGVLAFVVPTGMLVGIVVIFGVFSMIDGGVTLVGGIQERVDGKPAAWLTVQGIAGITAGSIALLWPTLTPITLLYVVAAWAILVGFAEITGAFRLRRRIEGELLLGATGVLSVVFGVLMVLFPGSTARSVVTWIAAYAIANGASMLLFALRLRRWNRSDGRPAAPGELLTTA